MAPIIVDKKQKRIHILNAALKVFSKKGTANTKIADIAKEAGIGKGTIYEYFKNKEDILNSLHKFIFSQYDEAISVKIFKIKDPSEKIRALVNAFTEVIDEVSFDTMKLYIEFWAESVRKREEEKMYKYQRKFVDEYRELIAGILDEGVRAGVFRKMNTKITGSILFASMDGLMFQIMLDSDVFTFKDACNEITELFLRGIRK